MPVSQTLFSSSTDQWATPQSFFNALNDEFNFTLDVGADSTNAKCVAFFTKEDDGLGQKWTGTCWMNPPYGKDIPKWMEKAYTSSVEGATVVCLVPARTDTKWFHDWVLGKADIRFVKGRLTFGNAANTAPFPSLVAVYRPLVAEGPVIHGA